MTVMRRLVAAMVGLAAASSGPALAGGKPVLPPALNQTHRHPSGAFTFQTPEGWTVRDSPGKAEILEARGKDVLVRFVYSPGEIGFDSLHVNCMLERLAPAMDTAPAVDYEYDFIGGVVAGRRALDSAFIVNYDNPIQGHRTWRQRTVTVVGAGHSLCVITYVPAPVWKKSPEIRALVDSVLGSVNFP